MLGDDKNGCRYIETVPKLGYRFVAGVKESTDAANEIVLETHTTARFVTEEEEHTDNGHSIAQLSAQALLVTKKQGWMKWRLGVAVAVPCLLVIGVLLQVGAGTGLTLVFGALALVSVVGFVALSLCGVETAQRPLDEIAQ